jgi:carbon monoxide dehydrogenase subunit G
MEFVDTARIEAPIQRVWDLTVNVERWVEFVPTVKHVERLEAGPLEIGSKTRLVQPHQGPRIWVVTELEAPRVFSWTSKSFGLEMTGRHLLEPTATGTTSRLELILRGPIAPLVSRLSRSSIHHSIQRENAALAAEAVRG